MSPPVLGGSPVWDLPARRAANPSATDEAAVRWADATGLCQGPAESGKLRLVRPGLLAAWTHPAADEADLALVAMWMSWLFLLDDRIDEGALGRDTDLLELRLQDLQAVALGVSGPTTAMGRGLAEIIGLAGGGMPTWWRLRFRRNVADYLAACVWQAAHRQAGQVPAPADFPARRRAFGAIIPSFDLIERTDGVLLAPSVHCSRPYQVLLLAAADLVCWTNDLMTAGKEAALGDPHNLVLVTAHHEKLDRPAAARIVSAGCERRLRDHARARRELGALLSGVKEGPDRSRAWQARQVRQAEYCADALLLWVRGHLEWGLVTPRYDHDVPDDGRGTRVGTR
ncbi:MULTISPECIES: terpene synthase [unclassified Streptomyces]|uniref:(-)-delta-cadinene synthase n=1 Tax=unclassified Streptomyces TaxID=2593676 RepID=UPI00380B81FC